MDECSNSGEVSAVELLDALVKNRFDDLMSSILITSGESSFLSIWRKQTAFTDTPFAMKYLPIFYVIASQEKETKLSLKLITYHGKILEELNGFDNLLSDEDKISFVGKLDRMQLCHGIRMPDNDLKVDASTFSAMYLVERLEQNVIVRSHQCQYGLYEDTVCKMCASLNTAYDANRMKHESFDEDSLYFNDNEEESIQTMYDDVSAHYLSSPLITSNTIYDQSLNVGVNGSFPVDCKLEKNRRKKTKVNEASKSEKGKKKSKLIKNGSKTVIRCKHCSYETTDIKLLMMHNIEVHSPRFNGSFCNETGMFQCDECSYSTTIKKEYSNHITDMHPDLTPHQCKLCGKVLGRKDSLKSHMNAVHKRPYKCPSCPYETAQESRLTRHIQAVHDKVKRYFCEQCSYGTSDSYSLKFHIKSVHEKLKPFICEQCTYATTTRQALNNHIKAVHEKLKPFLCELCSTSFSTKYLLVQHVSVIHNKVKEFKCKQCSYETARKYYLLDHIRSVHEKIKQFRCDLCSFETAVKCNLKNHILAVHEKCKPFQCQLCSFEAIRKKQLSQHIATTHNETAQV